MKSAYRVLVIDDDKEMRDSLTHLLEAGGFEVQVLPKVENVLSRMTTQQTDVLLCDVRMPGVTGIELQAQLAGQSTVPMVLMSAHGDIEMAVAAVQSGAYSFLEKPFDPRRLLRLLENAARLNRLSQDTLRLKERLADLSGLDRVLLGKTQPIEALRADIIDLSATDATVMLIGETGTGKELVARALHDLGPRAAEPFVALNCAAVPVAKFEETLFGARGRMQGLLAQAEGGTFFIDELDAIPPEIQPKLLRVIETRQYTPLDAEDARQADIRIISAGKPGLEDLIATSAFREDLYFRLNTVMLKLPPLRERRDDVALLYAHYLEMFAATYDIAPPDLTAGDVADLIGYDWPGNVRELRNVCERHVLAVRRGLGSVGAALGKSDGMDDVPGTLREAVAAFERQMIAQALVAHNGRMDDVADALGVGRRTLNEKIVKLGLDKSVVLQG